jgi:radical SAM protein (TIGR01212 family)
MALSERVHTFGQYLLGRYGERVHKLAIHAGFTCPNRDGSKGRGGCTFCNNVSFNPEGRAPRSIREQIASGRRVILRRTGAQRYLAYFQAYTNTYAEISHLLALYGEALQEEDVIGLAIGTRPDCVHTDVLDLLADYQEQGYEIWLELGLQSAFDETLKRVNRGHGFAEYKDTLLAARGRGIPVCTHLILGLPSEDHIQMMTSLERVLDLGVEGIKLHPLHVVRGTQLANEWRSGGYTPLAMEEYVELAAEMVERTPPEVVYHRLTGTASANVLLAPAWCEKKWQVLNGIEAALRRRRGVQGSAL